jgi:hypothetical protein
MRHWAEGAASFVIHHSPFIIRHLAQSATKP